MKYLALLIVLVIAYAWWRSSRITEKSARDARPPAAGPAAQPQDMIRCPVCSVHLPRGEAVAAPDGRLFCSQEHRLRGGDPPTS